MQNLLPGLWSRIEGACVLETDPPEIGRRKATLALIAILSCITGIVSVATTSATASPGRNVVVPVAFTIVVGVATILFFVTKRFALLLYPFLVMILCGPVLFQWIEGGFYVTGTVSIVFWSMLAPFGALMFQTNRKAAGWFGAYLVLIVLSLWLDDLFTPLAVVSTHTVSMIGHGVNIIGLSTTVFLTMMYFVNAFQREHAKVENLVGDLTETNSTLESTLNELRETQAELIQSEKMASVGKLAAGIAHEINNPIGALKSAADTSAVCVRKLEQLIEQGEVFAEIRVDAGFRKILGIIGDNSQVLSSASDRVTNTVSSFIDFTRLDAAEFDQADLHAGIDNTLVLLQQDVREGIRIVKEYADIPQIACYPGELNQVFMSLLSNALQAIEGEGQVTIRTFLLDERVHIQIADTGAGLSPDEIQGVFDPHFVKSESRVRAGWGLLAVHQIIKKHQGEISVESEPGEGSIFTIVLPTNLTFGAS